MTDATPEPIIIDEFEGEKVRFHRGKLPSINLDMAEGYPRGTHVFFRVEARVGAVGYDEITGRRDERRGELIRNHTLHIEEVGLLGVSSAAAASPGIGGSASNRVEEVDDFSGGAIDSNCEYDAEELTVIHKGGCQLCAGRSGYYAEPIGPVTEEEFLEAAGMRRRDPDEQHVDF